MAKIPVVKIVHVDDDETNRYITLRILGNTGFQLLQAATGKAGLQLVREQLPDLVILDVKLSDTSGFEVCRQIKAHPATASIPVLMLSALFVGSQDKAQGLDSGADAYLAQPVESIELLATIRALLRIRRAEDAALNLAKHWQITFDSMSDGIGLLDQEGRFLRCNQALLNFLNKPMNQLLGELHQDVMVARLGADQDLFLKVKETRTRETIEIQSGKRWYSIAVEPVLNEPEILMGAVYILTDITDRRISEENRFLLSAIVESSQDAIIGLTLKQVIITWNSGAERIFNYTAAEIEGQPISILASPECAQEQKEIFAAIKRGESITNFETSCLKKDGKQIDVSITISPIKNSEGDLRGISATVRDITERKRTEAERDRLLELEQAARTEAEAANRIKDEFLAVLSHELRSPLNPILGWAKLLQMREFDRASLKKALETIERNASLQAQLIEDLLDVSRILRGKVILKITPVNLVSTIESALETVRLAAEAKSIQIQTKLDPTVGRVLGDATRLQQIVWNLVSNAVKFTQEGGKVNISLERLDSHVQLTVSDTGKGIKSDFLPHVFEYFRQADSSITRRFGGLGLGLAIVRYLVELHGGTVWVESPGEEQGSIFRVKLPLQDSSKLSALSSELAEPTENHPEVVKLSLPLQGRRILVVDDEADARDFFAFVLEESGAIVTAVASANEALQVITQSEPDLLLCDIGMPDMDGYTLLGKVQAMQPKQGKMMPAIALTAYAGESDRLQAIAAGFQRHIAKPVTPEDLIREITETLNRF